MDRRTALVNLSSLGTAVALGTLERAHAEQTGNAPGARNLRKIATEEACTIPEVATALRDVVRAGGRNLDLPLLATIYDAPAGTQPRFLPELLDLDAQRLADMDRHGVQMHLLALTAPGVQMFDADTATSLARRPGGWSQQPAQAKRLFSAKLRDHDERCGGSAGASFLHRQNRSRSHHVGD